MDKVDAVRAELGLHPTTMIGDGIKDAPALVRIHAAQEDDIYDALAAA